MHTPTVVVGVLTVVLIVVLEKTRLGALGMVVAVVGGSGVAALFGGDVAQLSDIADPNSLPLPMLPDLSLILPLLVPDAALTFVGLVQSAGITVSFPNGDGSYPDPSQDFVGQGFGNVVSGFFQGMPVGGSMSASSLVKAAGARSRTAVVIALTTSLHATKTRVPAKTRITRLAIGRAALLRSAEVPLVHWSQEKRCPNQATLQSSHRTRPTRAHFQKRPRPA